MSSTHKKRLYVLVSLFVGLSIACALVLYALSQNINLFYTPTQIKTADLSPKKTVRVGGMVVKESVKRGKDLNIEFVVTDFNQEMTIQYKGILPDLFREGQGIVALGHLENESTFIATEVLAKHDEKYMPPEVAAGLKITSKDDPVKRN
jgi:cytochrome c-type biogenesis protein CcmE